MVYSLAGRAIIQDKGDKLLMLQTDRMAIETALRLAHAKFGDVLTVSAPKDFQERTACIAAEAGVQITFQNRKLEEIRQRQASELASERTKRAEQRELGGKFIDQQRRPAPAAPEVPKNIAPSEPVPSIKDKDKGRSANHAVWVPCGGSAGLTPA
ncbi:LPD7 domain-containing protein [Janthinobacterium sp. LS2A]|uniref:LPD7 domain-containing protein n=1 Tax=Janthinobacterium sp. LS2A TaxID=3118590 RepID=UPI002F9521B9